MFIKNNEGKVEKLDMSEVKKIEDVGNRYEIQMKDGIAFVSKDRVVSVNGKEKGDYENAKKYLGEKTLEQLDKDYNDYMKGEKKLTETDVKALKDTLKEKYEPQQSKIDKEVSNMSDDDLTEVYGSLEGDDNSYEAKAIRKEYGRRKESQKSKTMAEENKQDYDDEEFTMVKGDRTVVVSKNDEGKWEDSEGNKYMGYLSKEDVKSYFKGDWEELKEKQGVLRNTSSQPVPKENNSNNFKKEDYENTPKNPYVFWAGKNEYEIGADGEKVTKKQYADFQMAHEYGLVSDLQYKNKSYDALYRIPKDRLSDAEAMYEQFRKMEVRNAVDVDKVERLYNKYKDDDDYFKSLNTKLDRITKDKIEKIIANKDEYSYEGKYKKYLKEHPNSNMSFEEYKKWFK